MINEQRNPGTSSRPLPRVDTRSGRVRLCLVILSFLILWALLAAFLTYMDPAMLIPDFFDQAAGASGDLLNYYFSAFVILNLLILLVAFLCGFVLARRYVSEALQLAHPQRIGRYLRNCAFAFSQPAEVNPLSSDFADSDDQKCISALGGPTMVQLDPQHAAMLQDVNGNVAILFNENRDETAEYLIDYQEKYLGVLSCPPSGEQQYTLSFSALCEDGVKVKVEGLRAVVSNPFCPSRGNGELSSTKREQNSQPWIPAVDWDEFARESLRSEIKSFMLAHPSQEIRREIGVTGRAAPVQAENNASSGRLHSSTGHNPRLFAAGNGLRKNNPTLNLRNRRRSPVPELHSQTPAEEISLTPIPGLLEQLQDYLARTFKIIYNNAIIRPGIIDLGEITFDGIH